MPGLKNTFYMIFNPAYIIGLLYILSKNDSVAKWLSWWARNCGPVGAISSNPVSGLKPIQYIENIHLYIRTYMSTYVHHSFIDCNSYDMFTSV